MPITASTFPTRAEWTREEGQQADAEGWNLFDSSGSDHGRCQLQRDDEMGVFDGDGEAWRHVTARAREGSELHLRALRAIRTHNRAELDRILTDCGPVENL